MIEDAMNGEATSDEAVEKKSFKKRMAVTAMLTLAALGAHYLHGRPVPIRDADPAVSKAVDDEGATGTVAGPNSLFGEVCTDQKLDAPLSRELGANEQDLASLVNQAGAFSTASASLDGLDSSSTTQLSTDETGVSSAAALSAVPEPTTAGILLLAIAPAACSRRRPRHGKRITNLN